MTSYYILEYRTCAPQETYIFFWFKEFAVSSTFNIWSLNIDFKWVKEIEPHQLPLSNFIKLKPDAEYFTAFVKIKN